MPRSGFGLLYPHCFFMEEKEGERNFGTVSLIRALILKKGLGALILFMRVLTSRPNCFKEPHLLISSHWELAFQHECGGWGVGLTRTHTHTHTHLVHKQGKSVGQMGTVVKKKTRSLCQAPLDRAMTQHCQIIPFS